MNTVEANTRKNRKRDASTDRLVNTARLGVLEKHLGIPIKRYKDPGSAGDMRSGKGFISNQGFTDGDINNANEKGKIVMSGF